MPESHCESCHFWGYVFSFLLHWGSFLSAVFLILGSSYRQAEHHQCHYRCLDFIFPLKFLWCAQKPPRIVQVVEGWRQILWRKSGEWLFLCYDCFENITVVIELLCNFELLVSSICVWVNFLLFTFSSWGMHQKKALVGSSILCCQCRTVLLHYILIRIFCYSSFLKNIGHHQGIHWGTFSMCSHPKKVSVWF